MSTDPDVPHTSAAGLMEHVASPIDAEAAAQTLKHGARGAYARVGLPLLQPPGHGVDQRRRRFLQSIGILGGMGATFPAWAAAFIDLDLPGGPDRRRRSSIILSQHVSGYQPTHP